jgi:hypothetical protein
MMLPADRIAQLEYVIREQMAEIDRLRAVVDRQGHEIEDLVAWIGGEKNALSALQAVYVDPRTKPDLKVKAASAAAPYESAKVSSANGGLVLRMDWYKDLTKRQRLKANAEIKAAAGKLIEHQPTVEPSTILGREIDDSGPSAA